MNETPDAPETVYYVSLNIAVSTRKPDIEDKEVQQLAYDTFKQRMENGQFTPGMVEIYDYETLED